MQFLVFQKVLTCSWLKCFDFLVVVVATVVVVVVEELLDVGKHLAQLRVAEPFDSANKVVARLEQLFEDPERRHSFCFEFVETIRAGFELPVKLIKMIAF